VWRRTGHKRSIRGIQTDCTTETSNTNISVNNGPIPKKLKTDMFIEYMFFMPIEKFSNIFKYFQI